MLKSDHRWMEIILYPSFELSLRVKIRPLMDGNLFAGALFTILVYVKIRPLMDGNHREIDNVVGNTVG